MKVVVKDRPIRDLSLDPLQVPTIISRTMFSTVPECDLKSIATLLLEGLLTLLTKRERCPLVLRLPDWP